MQGGGAGKKVERAFIQVWLLASGADLVKDDFVLTVKFPPCQGGEAC